MKALVLESEGSFPELRDVPDPTPGPGHVLLRVSAAGLNYADTMMRRGFYLAKPSFPQIPGFEFAGTIVEAAPDVSGWKIGDRVMSVGQSGFAELAVAPAASLFPAPPEFSDEEAAAFLVTYLTAFGMFRIPARAQPGETILVHAAAGGVGTASIQLARHLGLRVIASASSEEKLALARKLGAEVTIDYTREDFVERVLEATGRRGADIIFESIGGDFLNRDIRAAAPFARIIVFGMAGGEAAKPDIEAMYANSVSVSAFWLVTVMRDPARVQPLASELLALVGPGGLRPVIGRVYRLADGAQAFRDIESRRSVGKLILKP